MQPINIASNSQQHSMLQGIVKQKKLEAKQQQQEGQQRAAKQKAKLKSPQAVYINTLKLCFQTQVRIV
jgi:hypothetical protein